MLSKVLLTLPPTIQFRVGLPILAMFKVLATGVGVDRSCVADSVLVDSWIAGPPGLTATGMCCTGMLGSLGVKVTWPCTYCPAGNWSPCTVTVKLLLPLVDNTKLAGATLAVPAGKPSTLSV